MTDVRGHARASCGSISAPRRASGRPSPCSARPTGGPAAAPTSWSAWSRPTAGPRPRPCSSGLEVRAPPDGRPTAGVELDRARRRRRAGPTPRRGGGRRAGPHQRPRLPAPQALAGRRGHPRRRHHVLSTVNIQHLESLNDVVERITGVRQQETVPDEVVRRAEQVELVDITPEALRRRLAHGNVYPADRSTRRWPTTSSRATSPRCARWPCSGWPTRSRSRCSATATDQRHHRHLGDPGTGRGRAHRRPGERDACCAAPPASPSAPARRELFAVHVLRGDGLVGASGRRAGRAAHGWPRTSARRSTPVVGDDVPAGAARLRPRRRRHPAGAGHLAAGPGWPGSVRRGHRRPGGAGLRAHRRAHGHPRRGRPGAAAAPAVQRRPGCAARPPGWALGPCCCRWPPSGSACSAGSCSGCPPTSCCSSWPPWSVALVGGLGPALLAAFAGGAAAQLLPHPTAVHVHHRRARERDHAGGHGAGRGAGRAGRRPRRPAGPAGRRGPRRGRPAGSFSRTVLHRRRAAAAAAGPGARGLRPDHGAPCCSGATGSGNRPHAPARADCTRPDAGRRRRRRGTRTSTSSARAGRCRPPTGGCSTPCAGQALLALRNQQIAAEAAEAAPPRRRHRDCAPPCSPPSATTCAPRWPSIKAAAGGLRDPYLRLSDADRDRAGRHHRRVGRPAHPGGQQPARLVPAGHRGAVAPSCARSATTRSPSLALRGLDPGVDPGGPAGDRRAAAGGAGRPRPAGAGGGQPGGQRAAARRAGAPGHAARPAATPTTSSCGWSTTAPACRRGRDRTCSPRSSGSATAPRRARARAGVARGLTEAMGGTLTAEDTPGGGLTMVISLPAVQPSPSRRRQLTLR